ASSLRSFQRGRTGDNRTSPFSSDTSTSEDGCNPAPSANGFGIRTARLLPHFWTLSHCTSVSTMTLQRDPERCLDFGSPNGSELSGARKGVRCSRGLDALAVSERKALRVLNGFD